jgi:hypothetical protein
MIEQYKALICAIIDRAVKDVRYGYETDALDALKFFYSEYFEWMADIIDIDALAVRSIISDLVDEREN